MAMNPNMANREVMNLVLLDYKTKVPYMNIDFANVSTTNFTANRVYAKGGWGAPNRVGFDGERTGTLQIDTQIMPAKLFALLSGKDIAKTAKVLKREELAAGADGLELAEEPKTGTVQVFAASDDCGTPIEGVTATGKKLLLPVLPRTRTTLFTTTWIRPLVCRASSLTQTPSRRLLRSAARCPLRPRTKRMLCAT